MQRDRLSAKAAASGGGEARVNAWIKQATTGIPPLNITPTLISHGATKSKNVTRQATNNCHVPTRSPQRQPIKEHS